MPRLAIITACSWLLTIPGTILVDSFQMAVLTEDGSILGESPIVVLDPASWVGRPWSLLKYVDGIGEDLGHGRWIVVLHDRQCHNCLALLQAYARHYGGQPEKRPAFRLALVEIPPFASGEDGIVMGLECSHGTLSAEREWYVEKPVEIVLDAGVVRGVQVGKTTPIEFPNTMGGP
jgi:hypothetical protein